MLGDILLFTLWYNHSNKIKSQEKKQWKKNNYENKKIMEHLFFH